MKNFNRNDRRERRDFGRSDYQEKRMFHATCANCGRDCEVPFKPRGDKPVYCKDCFRKQRDNREGGGNSYSAPQTNAGPQLNDQFAKLNAKLDKVLSMLNPVEPKKEQKAQPEIEKPIAKKTPAKKVVLKKKAVRKKK